MQIFWSINIWRFNWDDDNDIIDGDADDEFDQESAGDPVECVFQAAFGLPWTPVPGHGEVIMLMTGWHKLGGILKVRLDLQFYPQSAYVEIFSSFATKMP